MVGGFSVEAQSNPAGSIIFETARRHQAHTCLLKWKGLAWPHYPTRYKTILVTRRTDFGISSNINPGGPNIDPLSRRLRRNSHRICFA